LLIQASQFPSVHLSLLIKRYRISVIIYLYFIFVHTQPFLELLFKKLAEIKRKSSESLYWALK
jgi:hypothetical protein